MFQNPEFVMLTFIVLLKSSFQFYFISSKTQLKSFIDTFDLEENFLASINPGSNKRSFLALETYPDLIYLYSSAFHKSIL